MGRWYFHAVIRWFYVENLAESVGIKLYRQIKAEKRRSSINSFSDFPIRFLKSGAILSGHRCGFKIMVQKRTCTQAGPKKPENF
tara:strand:- start:33124 stop:33375 length:252 start_codon:yes stop_codon:yes gene_type:complete